MVALEEEPADDSAETVAGEDIEVEWRRTPRSPIWAWMGSRSSRSREEEETGSVREKIVEKMIERAAGRHAGRLMLPCVVIMILVGLMGSS